MGFVLYHGEVGERFIKEAKGKLPDELIKEVAELLREHYLFDGSNAKTELTMCSYRIRHQRMEITRLLEECAIWHRQSDKHYCDWFKLAHPEKYKSRTTPTEDEQCQK